MAQKKVKVADIDATGTPGGSTFYCGDDSWKSAGVSNHASLSNLNWSAAAHTFDADLNVGAYSLLSNIGLKLKETGSTPTYYTILQSGDLTGADSTYTLPTAYPAGNNYLLKSSTAGVMGWTDPSTLGVTDHGALTGLADDDHTQYSLLLGRAGGQTIIGGTGSGDDLTLQTTSNGTKGTYFLSDLTSNGFIKTSGSNGTLGIDTNVYLTAEADTLTSVTGRGANTPTAVQFQNALAIELGKNVGAGNVAGSMKLWSAGVANNFYTTITAPIQTGNVTISTPTALPAGTYLMNMTNAGAMDYVNPASDFATQYALLLGRAGGQTLIGGLNAGDNLNLKSTSIGIGVHGDIILFDRMTPTGDNATDLGAFVPAGAANRFRHLYLAGNISDGTNSLTVANAKTAYDHSQIGNVSPHVPTGSVLMYGAAVAPTGYLLCDGATYPTATYPALFAIIAYLYGGAGPNFKVPDLKLKFPKGYDGILLLGTTGGAASNTPGFTGSALGNHSHMPSLSSDSAGAPAGSIDAHVAGKGGSVGTNVFSSPLTHTFTGAPMANHTHTPANSADSAGTPAGSISAVPTEPPYLVINYIIKT